MQIRFTFETEYGSFSDALYLDEGHSFTEAEVEAMKQERLSNWIAVLETPPTEEVPPIEKVTPVEEV